MNGQDLCFGLEGRHEQRKQEGGIWGLARAHSPHSHLLICGVDGRRERGGAGEWCLCEREVNM